MEKVCGVGALVAILAGVAILTGYSVIGYLAVIAFLGGGFWLIRKSGEQRRLELEPVYKECDNFEAELARSALAPKGDEKKDE